MPKSMCFANERAKSLHAKEASAAWIAIQMTSAHRCPTMDPMKTSYQRRHHSPRVASAEAVLCIDAQERPAAMRYAARPQSRRVLESRGLRFEGRWWKVEGHG